MALVFALAQGAVRAQIPIPPSVAQGQASDKEDAEKIRNATNDVDPYWDTAEAWRELRHAVVRLPLAAILAAALAFRPRRPGTPSRKAPVIQTQIILALVGAVVMLVVGVSLARAFGIVGAAGLIRYRAKIDDPKDAGVMLSTLAIGLASGVGLYFLAIFTSLFILACLWLIESFEPEATKLFQLKVTLKDSEQSDKLRNDVELLMRRSHVDYELRAASPEELSYEVKMPYQRKTDRLSTAIVKLGKASDVAVEWEEKKEKK
jgi:uncharacterized membrane protein YhiD involved in acid resistance